MKLSIPEITEILMTQAEDICLICASGYDVTHEDGTFWHNRDGIRRECRAHEIHRAIKRFEKLEDMRQPETVA